jgi:hypothetical protein
MTDVIGNEGGMNSVDHDKILLHPTTDGSWHQLSIRSTVAPFGTCKLSYMPYPVSYYIDPILTHLSMSSGQSIAVNKIPDFGPAQLDGIVSLYESPELYTLVKTLQNIPVHILYAMMRAKKGSVMDAKRWLRETFVDTSGRRKLKQLAGIDLTWKFGIKPFLDDIQKVHSALGALEARIARLKQKTYTVAGQHKQEVTQVTVPVTGYVDPVGATMVRVELTKTTRRTDTAGSTRRLTDAAFANIDSLRLAAVRESLGLNPSASTLWTVTPLSFIVDWFLPISDFLDSLGANMPNESWFTVQSSWTSTLRVTEVKANITRRTIVRPQYITVSGSDTFQNFTDASRRNYVRTPGIPRVTPVHIPRPRLPKSMGQWTSLLEVAISRFLR